MSRWKQITVEEATELRRMGVGVAMLNFGRYYRDLDDWDTESGYLADLLAAPGPLSVGVKDD